jgi:hypothetical protein
MRALILSLLIASAMHGAEATRLVAAPDSAVVLDGSSNLAGWRCRSTSIDAIASVATSPDHLNDVIDRIENGQIGIWMTNRAAARFPVPELRLRVPVAAFRCGNRVMESDMRRALKADRNPSVDFVFRTLHSGIEHDFDAGVYRARVSGDLTLAGATRSIDLRVSAERLSRTTFRLRAQLPLRMTDFAVEPPSALFGAIRARDELIVHFDLRLEIAP